MNSPTNRREMLKASAAMAAMIALRPAQIASASGGSRADPDHARLDAWAATLRAERALRAGTPFGRDAIRVGELASGTPYVAGTLDAYLRSNRRASRREPLTLSLSRFDCVTLVEGCLGVARAEAHQESPSWNRFGREIERMRYRGGERIGYASRLHYFSEWISDGEARGLVRDIGPGLGAVDDVRPLRFMTEHRSSYPALKDERVLREIAALERRLDERPRRLIPRDRIAAVAEQIQSGDVLAFATSIPGLDVSHAAFAYRDAADTLGVLHAPLSGGVVEIARAPLAEYVAAITRCTGILVARPQRA